MINVMPRSRMFLSYLRELASREVLRRSYECRPNPFVYESHLIADKTTDENIGRVRYAFKGSEDMIPFRVAPPTPLNRLVGNSLNQPGYGPLRRDQDDAMFPNVC